MSALHVIIALLVAFLFGLLCAEAGLAALLVAAEHNYRRLQARASQHAGTAP